MCEYKTFDNLKTIESMNECRTKIMTGLMKGSSQINKNNQIKRKAQYAIAQAKLRYMRITYTLHSLTNSSFFALCPKNYHITLKDNT